MKYRCLDSVWYEKFNVQKLEKLQGCIDYRRRLRDRLRGEWNNFFLRRKTMNSTSMKIWTTLFVAVVLSGGLLVLNGCKKSEPAPTKTSSNTMQGMQGNEHAAMTTKAATETAAAGEQTICPVMGNPINKDIFVEYKGKKVYFCCPECKAKFEAEPEKYIAKLPQFKQ
jgi:YHS domain-containing protein